MVAILPKTDSGPSTNFFTSVTGSYTRFLVYSSSLYPSLSSFTVSTYSDKNCRYAIAPITPTIELKLEATPYPSKQYALNPAPYFSVSVFNSLFNASYSLSDSIFFSVAGLGCEYRTFLIFSSSFCSHFGTSFFLSSSSSSSSNKKTSRYRLVHDAFATAGSTISHARSNARISLSSSLRLHRFQCHIVPLTSLSSLASSDARIVVVVVG
mmetsp:Transcript_3715/g.11480  ORF Transcript_3715/g.11480 Transcript_3715/m.11480 type:complete len:210 (-) Transcript_3715:22-651(-)